MNRTQDNISFYNTFYNRLFSTNVHPKSMIINSTYTVYKRGTKTTRESRACLPVTGTFTFFNRFFFFFVFFCHIDSLDMYTHRPIEYQREDIWSGISFVLSAHLRNTLFFFETVYAVKRQHAASLHTCIKTEISSLQWDFQLQGNVNTDCVGEIRAKVAQKHLSTDAASKERYCS